MEDQKRLGKLHTKIICKCSREILSNIGFVKDLRIIKICTGSKSLGLELTTKYPTAITYL